MTRWIGNFNFATKLVVIAIAVMAPLIVLTLLFLSEKQKSIDSNARELSGLQRELGLATMLLSLGMHEVWSTDAASGLAVADKAQAAGAQVTRAVAEQDVSDDGYGAPPGEDARRWNEVKYSWNTLATAGSASAAEVMRLHSQLRRRILDYRDYIVDTSGLRLDGDAIGWSIIDAAVIRLPNYQNYLSELRERAASVGAAGKPTPADLDQITRTEVLAQSELDEIDADIRRASKDRDGGGVLRAGAEQALSQVKSSFESFDSYVRQIASSGSSRGASASAGSADLIDATAISRLQDAMQQAALQRLQNRLADLRGSIDRKLLLVAAAMVIGLGSLSTVIWTTVDGVNEAMSRVQESSLALASAARQISAGTSGMSARTEQQAVKLAQTAASMQLMTTTLRHNADTASLADKLAHAARDQAGRGGAIVERAADAMGAIDSANRKIADIIAVIDEIALQTNLLALNAVVEAARAGDQGRGFAVVASEVRSLAQRNASAVREIKGMIHDSAGKLAEGSRLVSDSGLQLRDIVASVRQVSELVGEISNACQEQAASAGEISRAVLQMDQSTQQNAAMVEQARAAAASMKEQAARLSQLTALLSRSHGDDSGAGAVPATTGDVGAQQPVALDERRGGTRPWSKASARAAV